MSARSTIDDALNFASKLTYRKVWNYARLGVSYWYSVLISKSCHAGMPFNVSVEPTTSCNLRCPECPSGNRRFSRTEGNIEIESFKQLLDQLKGHLSYLMLYFQGEPFLHPEYLELIHQAEKRHIYTATSTNAHFLRGDTARKVVESGLDRLIVPMDGTDQETYMQYRKGGDFDTVQQGVMEILDWKRKLRSRTPYVILQFLVFKHNEHQIPEMKRLAKELGVDKLEFKSAQVYNFEEEKAYIPESKKYSRYVPRADGRWKLKKAIRNRCFRMWSGAVITWDGRVVPCCFDKDADHQLGKLSEQEFRAIWKGRKYNSFRLTVLTNRAGLDICKNCTE